MLGRRQLRAKAMQSIYSYYRSGDEVRKVEKNMMNSIGDIKNLYYHLLTLLPAIKYEADKRIEIGLGKNMPTEEEANPKMNFSKNKLIKQIIDNIELRDFADTNKQLSWEIESVYPAKLLRELQFTEKFKKYQDLETPSYKKDKEIVLYLIEEIIAPDESLSDFLEDKHLHWADDQHIANTMLLNTIRAAKNKEEGFRLFTLVTDEEHLDFTRDLFRQTIANEEELQNLIKERTENWEFDRIALIDRVILQMALTEYKYFPSIPPKVTLNEYVEIAKDYSTDKSKVFINGVLDKTLKDLKASKSLNKYGAGLL